MNNNNNSWRYSTKNKNKVRLSVAKRKPGPKRKLSILSDSDSTNKDSSISTDLLASEVPQLESSLLPSTSQQDVLRQIDIDRDNIINTSQTKRKKLTMSSKRKRRIIPVGLLKWKLNRKSNVPISEPTNSDLETPMDTSNYFAEAVLNSVDLPTLDTEESSRYAVTSSHDSTSISTCIEETPALNDYNPKDLNYLMIIDTESEPPPLIVEPRPCVLKNINNIEVGNYIVDGLHFVKCLRKLELHRSKCPKNGGYMQLVSSNVSNMVWKMVYKCPLCLETTIVKSQPDQPGTSLTMSDKAVWGFASIGSGHENMEEVFTAMEIKSICPKTFRRTETRLGEVWHDSLYSSMKEAGELEKKLAIEAGDVNINGIPFITVIVDGGWSKRSHGHRYSANSGVACVIGKRTNKLLDIGVRSKYCSMCNYRDKKGLDSKHDKCYKNWDGPSASMESDMLVEAFKRSNILHGLEYRTIVGDGDSSVYYKLRTSVPYGRSIQKVECANHAVKNYTKRLYGLQKESEKLRKIFNGNIIKRLKTAARGAIIHNANDRNVNALKEDLNNGPLHVFNVHKNCKPYFCIKHGEESEIDPQLKEACDKALIMLRPLIAKRNQLVTNMTSNSAETFMSLVAKFTGGKQVNRGKRDSFTTRTNAAGLDYQLGPQWHYLNMKVANKKSPACLVKKVCSRRAKKRLACMRSLFKTKQDAGKNKKPKVLQKTIGKGTKDYGERALQIDMDEEDLNNFKIEKLKQLNITGCEIQLLEKETRDQEEDGKWGQARKDRLTASNFGFVCKRKATSSWAPVVKKILYGDYKNDAMIYGSLNESNAIESFQLEKGLVVQKCGFFVHKEYGFLGASPDGLVGDDALIEVKCPSSVRELTIEEACCRKKAFCIDKKSKTLKKSHNYFYQIQGQLQVTGRNKCYFVVWTPKDVHIEEIIKDDNWWEKKMKNKLIYCYNEALLPEIIDSRHLRSLPIREPETKFNVQ